MYMKLDLIFKDESMQTILVKTAWQDSDDNFSKLYYERYTDEPGHGTFIDINELIRWKLRPEK